MKCTLSDSMYKKYKRPNRQYQLRNPIQNLCSPCWFFSASVSKEPKLCVKHRLIIRQRRLSNLEFKILGISNTFGPFTDHSNCDQKSPIQAEIADSLTVTQITPVLNDVVNRQQRRANLVIHGNKLMDCTPNISETSRRMISKLVKRFSQPYRTLVILKNSTAKASSIG
jgi:hypothetical protein